MSITIKQNILTENNCYKSGKTRKPIGMQLHTIGAAQNSASSLASYWNQPGLDTCVHYCCDAEHKGIVYQFLPENYRSYADAGFGNGNLITVELMESDYMKYTDGANYIITNETKFKADITRAYNTAVEFFALKCKEYGWNPQEKMANGLYRVSSHDEGRRLGLSSSHVDPTHIWNRYGWTMDKFRQDVVNAMNGEKINVITPTLYRVRLSWEDSASQIGAYSVLENAKKAADENPGFSVYDESGNSVYTSPMDNKNSNISLENQNILDTLPDYMGIPSSKEDYLNKVSEIAVKLYAYTQILPSVVIAQACLENGFGLGEDAKELTKRNNLIGQKADLINSTWSEYTVWNGDSFSKQTPEVYNGIPRMIVDSFRVFPSYKYSLLDYEMFLTHVKNDNGYKYRDVIGMTDPRDVITIISQRGYATDPRYIISVMDIINRYNLRMYDVEAGVNVRDNVVYRVELGPYEKAAKAHKIMDKIAKKTGESSFLDIKDDGKYYVICGVFKSETNALNRAKLLQSKKLQAIVKEVAM